MFGFYRLSLVNYRRIRSQQGSDMRKKMIHLIIIGGTGRNIGKTEFVCGLIQRHSSQHQTYGLKVSAIFPDEMHCHGGDKPAGNEGNLFEEINRDSFKDTSRMLRAGAKRVFFLCGDNEDIISGFEYYLGLIPDGGVIVCESNSLAEYIDPGLYVMIRTASTITKERARKNLGKADLVVTSTGQGGFPELEEVMYSPKKGWFLKKRVKPVP